MIIYIKELVIGPSLSTLVKRVGHGFIHIFNFTRTTLNQLGPLVSVSKTSFFANKTKGGPLVSVSQNKVFRKQNQGETLTFFFIFVNFHKFCSVKHTKKQGGGYL